MKMFAPIIICMSLSFCCCDVNDFLSDLKMTALLAEKKLRKKLLESGLMRIPQRLLVRIGDNCQLRESGQEACHGIWQQSY